MKTSTLTIRVTAEQRAAFAQLAESRGTTITGLVLSLLDAPTDPEARARAAAAACPEVAELLFVHARLSAAVYTHAKAADELSAIGDAAGAEQARLRSDALYAAAGRCADLVAFARAAEKVRGGRP